MQDHLIDITDSPLNSITQYVLNLYMSF